MAKLGGQRVLGVPVLANAGIVALVLYWGPSKGEDGSDTVLTNEGDNPSQGVDIGLPEAREVDGEQLHIINLAAIPEVANLPEGEYDFGVAYKDAANNEGDIQEAEDVTIDLTPPPKPTKVVVISAP